MKVEKFKSYSYSINPLEIEGKIVGNVVTVYHDGEIDFYDAWEFMQKRREILREKDRLDGRD